MSTVNTPPRLIEVALSAVFASAILLAGCDRQREVPQPPNVPEQQLKREAAAVGEEQPPGALGEPVGSSVQEPPSALDIALADIAVADVKPTQNHEANGTVTFTPAEQGGVMTIHIELAGLTPGNHGLHIHEFGDCSAPDAMSAGDHHNPTNAPHGSPQEPPHHLGDLGNVEADADGRVNTTVTVSEVAIAGPTSVLDKAVVVHAQPDDLQSQPSGNSGDRIGCGVIRPNSDVLAGAPPDDAPVPP